MDLGTRIRHPLKMFCQGQMISQWRESLRSRACNALPNLRLLLVYLISRLIMSDVRYKGRLFVRPSIPQSVRPPVHLTVCRTQLLLLLLLLLFLLLQLIVLFIIPPSPSHFLTHLHIRLFIHALCLSS